MAFARTNRNGTFTPEKCEFKGDFNFTALFATFSADSGLKYTGSRGEIVTELFTVRNSSFRKVMF